MPPFLLLLLVLWRIAPVQSQNVTGALPGMYSNSGSPSPCPHGHFCLGGMSPPLPCTCASACPTLGIASDPWGLVWSVTTLAGSGLPSTVNGVGTAAQFTSLFGLGIDVQQGVVFISTNSGGVIRRVDPLGVVSTYAGSTTVGYLDGVGAAARMNNPQSSAYDPLTQLLYFADVNNNRIRAISPTGLVSTIAGSGTAGTANGVGTNAQFGGMSGAAVDEMGNIYASCFGANNIRKVTAGTYVVTTLAGTGALGYADGTGALAQFRNPWDLDASRDGSGLLYVADQGNNRIRVVNTTSGFTTTLAGQTLSGTADTPITGLALGGTTPLGWNAQFVAPTSAAWAPSGALVVQDFTAGCRLRLLSSTTGAVVTMAGSPTAACGYADGTGQAVLFSPIVGVGMDVNGTVYVADNGNLRVRKATCSLCPLGSYCIQGSPYPCPAGRFGATPGLTTPDCSGPCTAAAGWGCPAGSTSARGALCPAQSFCPGGAQAPLPCTCPSACPTPGTPNDPLSLVWNVSTLSGSGVSSWVDGVGTGASWGSPNGAASIAASGVVYTSDVGSARAIRMTTPGGVVSTLAGSGIAGNADGAGAAASFQAPASIALDPSGVLYVVDGNPGHRLRRVTPLGVVSTVAGVAGSAGWLDGPCATALFSNPNGVTVFTSLPGTASVVGVTTVFVAENSGHRVRAVTTTTPCMVSTLAGSPLGTAGFADGLGFSALFNQPWGLDADPRSGALYVGDWLNNRIRSVSPIGMVGTLAGSGAVGWADAVVGAGAMFSAPVDVTFIPSGQLLVSDFTGHRVRLVDAGSGQTRTLAGSGVAGYWDGPGNDAVLRAPVGLTWDATGAVTISDAQTFRLRRATCSACPLGSYCIAGKAYACPPGVWSNASAAAMGGGLSTPLCSGPCTAAPGWGCGAGSTSPAGSLCSPGFYCPGGAQPPIPCTCPASCPTPGAVSDAGVSTVDGSSLVTWVSAPFAANGTPGFANGPQAMARSNAGRGMSGRWDPSGSFVYLGEDSNNRVRTLSPTGVMGSLAGGGAVGFADGIGTSALFNRPMDADVDPTTGNVYVPDLQNARIRKITPGGLTTTLAGSGAQNSVDGLGVAASFKFPHALSVDPGGNFLVVADLTGCAVRRIPLLGLPFVVTLAGLNSVCSFADSVVGTSARFNEPIGVAVSTTGMAYIADFKNHRIRLITLATNAVSTLAGSSTPGSVDGSGSAASFNNPHSLRLDPRGEVLYVNDNVNLLVRRIVASTGVVSTLAGVTGLTSTLAFGPGPIASWRALGGISPATPGQLLIWDNLAHRGSVLTCSATIPPLPTPPGYWWAGMTYGVSPCPAGFFGAAAGLTNSTCSGPCTAAPGYGCIPASTSPAGVLCPSAFYCPGGASPPLPCDCPSLCLGSAPRVMNNASYWQGITVAGVYATSGNADGTGSVARFAGARGLAVGPGGTTLYTTEDTPNNRIRVLNVVGGWGGAVTVSPLAGNSGAPNWVDGIGSNAAFNRPLACTLHPSGSPLYVADLLNNRIRAVTTSGGVVTTIAGTTAPGVVDGVGSAASFNWPYGIAIHPSGLTLLVADFNGRRVRSITLATATVVTLAGNTAVSGFQDGYRGSVLMTIVMGLAFLPSPSSPGAAQIVYFADANNNAVRSLNTSSGWVRTFGGSVTGVGGAADGASGTSTLLSGPGGVTVDSGGNVFVAMGPRLRRLAGFTGASTTIGSGVAGGGDGAGTSLTFNGLFGLAHDPILGNVFAADTGGSTIRALTCAGVGGGGCPVGFYCVLALNAGAPTPCPAGTWGGVSGLGTPSCSGNCSAAPGFGCYPGSTTPAGTQCLPGWWCPGGSTPPQPCSCFSACATRGATSDPLCWWSVGTLAGGGGVGATNGVGTSATFGSLTDVTFGGVGGVWPAYAADFSNNIIRQIDSGGGVTTFAGSGAAVEADGIGLSASFRNVQGVGGVLVNSSSAGGQGLGLGVSPSANPLLGSIFAADAGDATLRRITLPSATVSTLTATLANPADAAADMQFVYVSSQSQHSIRAWNASSGVMSVLAGSGTPGWADGSGGAAVRFNFPTYLALIPTSPLLAVCDSTNHVLRLISLLLTPQPSLAVIPTFPFSPLSPSWGLTRTLAGTPTSAGFADGPGAVAKFSTPSGLASDPGGVALYVGDAGNHRVRRVVISTGFTTTLVGLGVAGWVDGPTSMALVNAPQGIAVHGTFGGLLLLCDKLNNRLRTINPTLGCPLGSWCGPGGAPPTPCQPGTFGNTTSATSAASGCVPCTAAPGWGCPAGSTSAGGVVCPIGFFCPGGATPPTPCACPFNCASVGLSAGDGGGAPQWVVTTLGGTGAGTSLDAPSATSATFFQPLGIAVSPNSTFFNASLSSRPDTSFTVAVAEYGGRKIRTLYLNGSAPPSSPLTAYNTQTLAGSGVFAFTQGLGTAAAFQNPSSVAYSPSGTLLYVAEAGVGSVRVVTLRGVVSLLAGGAVGGFVEGVGGAARFANPCSCAADASLVYVADQSNQRIRSITPSGTTSTVAGSGVAGFVDGGVATAMFNFPTGVAVPAEAIMGGGGIASKLFVVDSMNHRVRVVDMLSGVVSTLAGRGATGWVDGAGLGAALFNRPNSVFAWVGGWLWVSDQNNHLIRQVSPTGEVTTIGGGGTSFPGYLDAPGTVARFNAPGGIALSPPTSTVLVAGYVENRVRALTCYPCPLGRFCKGGAPTLCPMGVFGSVGGQGSPACSGPCTAPPGNFCPPGSTNSSGIPCPPGSACAGGSSPPTPCLCPIACALPGSASDPAVGFAGGGTWSVTTPAGSGAPVSAAGVGFTASFRGPTGLAWDSTGNGLLVASFMDSTLLSMDVGASGVGSRSGVAPVVKLAGTGVAGYANGLGNGGALINGPQGISPGLTPGTFYVCDYSGNRIRTLSGVNGSATGGVTVGLLAGSGSAVQTDGVGAAAGIKSPSGLALDASTGTLYVCEETGYAIRAVTLSTAAVVRVAGTGVAGFGDASPGTSAAFNNPTALVLDTYPYSIPSPCAINPMGGGGGCWRLLVADWVNNRIRSIGPPPTFSVTTLAGTGSATTTDGVGTAAAFNGPRGIACDGLGNAFVTEWVGGAVRRLALGTTTVTTIVGQGWNAFGFNSAYATLPHPLTGVLYVTDFNYQRVRALTCSVGCPVGSFCPSTMGGASLLCPAGTWGGSPGLTTPACSGNCSAAPGWGCGPGSTSPTGTICSPGYFCPGGAHPPTPCACPGISPTGVLSDGCSASGLVVDVSAGLQGGVTWSSATVVGGPGGTGNWDGPTPSTTTHARTIGPLGLAFSPDGTTLFHASFNGHNVRAIDVASWNMDSLAGQAVCGAVEGLGSVSRVCSPFEVVGDGVGGYYVAEAGNNRIRRLTPLPPSTPLGGTVGWLASTFVGSAAGSDVDGVGTSAVIPGPVGLLLDGPTLYVTEEAGCTVRGVDTGSARVWGFVGRFGLCGFLEGVGSGALISYPTSMALDRRGGGVNRMLIAECNNNVIRTVSLLGGVDGAVTSTLLGNRLAATVDGVGVGASLKCPRGLVVDGGGWGFVSEFTGHTIRRFHLDTLVLTTLMGSPVGAAGYVNGVSGGAIRFSSPLNLALFPPTPPLATLAGARGGLLVSDFANNVIRSLTCTPCPSGGVYCPNPSSPPIPCPPGTWGGGPGLLTPTCSGPCTSIPGFGCPAGSVNASGVVCPGGYFCPGGASPPTPCTCPSACPPGSALSSDPTTSLVWTSSTLAGNGLLTYVDGVGTAATMGTPFGLGLGPTGTVYVGDSVGRHVRSVTVGGVTATLAGTGLLGGADGAGAVASFSNVESNCVDPTGSFLYVGETGAKVRRVTLPGGLVSTMVGTGVVGRRDGLGASALLSQPCGMACASNGNVWLLDVGQGNTVRMMTPAGALTTVAGGMAGFANGQGTNARFGGGWDLDVGPDNTVYIADKDNQRIRMVSPTGFVSTLAGSGVQGWADGIGVAAMFSMPVGIAYHPSGTLVTGDFSGGAAHKIRLINIASGAVMTIGGGVSGAGYVEGEGMDALFNAPVGVSIDLAGNVAVADSANHRLRRLTCSACPLGSFCVNGRSRLCSPGFYGNTSTNGATTCSGPCTAAEGWGCFAGSTTPMGTLCPPGWACLGGASPPRACTCRSACPNPGTLFEYSGTVWSVSTLAGSGVSGALNGVGTLATFSNPFGVALVESTLYVTTGDNRLRAIALPSATVTTFVGSGTAVSIDGVGVGASLHVPQSIFNANTTLLYLGEDLGNRIRAVSLPGGSTTTLAGGTAAGYADGVGTTGTLFTQPTGVVVDPGTGMIYVSECTGNRVRRVTPAGVVTTLAAGGFNCPWGIALGLTGQLYVGDMNTNLVKSVSLVGGLVSVVAGSGTAGWADGVGSNARFTKPVGVLVDRVDSMLYVTEFAPGNRIRRIDPGGMVVTIVGSVSGASGLVNGLGTAALLNGPIIMTINPSTQELYVADRYNHAVRRLVCVPPTITPMPSPTPSASGGVTASPSWGTLTPSTSPSPSYSSTTSATTSGSLGGTDSPTSFSSPTPSSSHSQSGSESGSPSASGVYTVAPAGSLSPSVSNGGTASPSSSASASGTASGSGSATASATPTPTTTLSPGASASVTPSGSPSTTPTSTGSGTGSITPSAVLASSSASPTASPTVSPTPSVTSPPSPSLSPTPSPTTTITTTPTPSLTIGASASSTSSPSLTATPTETPSSSSTTEGVLNNPSLSTTLSPTPTPTPTPTTSTLPSSSPTSSPSPTASLSTGASPSGTGSDSTSGTPTPSSSGSGTGTASSTPSTTLSGSTTISTSPTASLTLGVSPSNTASKSQSGSVTPPLTPSPTPTATPTSSATGTASITSTSTLSGSSTLTVSPTAFVSNGLSASNTGSNSLSSSSTGTQTPTSSSTLTPTSSSTGTSSITPSTTLSESSTLSSSPTSSLSKGASPSVSGSPSTTGSLSSTGSQTPTSTGTSSPTGTSTSAATPTSTVSGSSTVTTSPTASLSVGASPSGTPSTSPSPSVSGSGSISTTPTPTPTATSTPSPTATTTSTPSGSSTVSSSQTPSLTRGASPSNTPSSTQSPSVSASPSFSGTGTVSPTSSATGTASGTVSVSPTSSLSQGTSPSVTPTTTPTPSLSTTNSLSATGSATPSPSATPTSSLSPGASGSTTSTQSASGTPTQTPTGSVTVGASASTTSTCSFSATSTSTPTPSLSVGLSPSSTSTSTLSGSPTASPTPSLTKGASGSTSSTNSLTASPTVSPTASVSLGLSASTSSTSTLTASPSPTPSSSITLGASPSTSSTATLSASPTSTPTSSLTQGVSSSSSSTSTLTSSPSATPTSSLSNGASSSSTSTSSLTSSPTATPSSSVTLGASASTSGTSTLTASPSQTPTSSLSVGLSPSATSTPTLSGSPTSSPTPSLTFGASPSSTSTSSLTGSPTQTPTPSITKGASPSTTSSSTLSGSPTITPTGSLSKGSSPSATSSNTLTGSPTTTPTTSATLGSSGSTTSTATLSASPTGTPSPTLSLGASPSTSSTATLSASPTSSPTPTLSLGSSTSTSSSATLSSSPSGTPTPTLSSGASPSSSSTRSLSPSPTASPTPTLSLGASPSTTTSLSSTPTSTPTPTPSLSSGSSPSVTPTAQPSRAAATIATSTPSVTVGGQGVGVVAAAGAATAASAGLLSGSGLSFFLIGTGAIVGLSMLAGGVWMSSRRRKAPLSSSSPTGKLTFKGRGQGKLGGKGAAAPPPPPPPGKPPKQAFVSYHAWAAANEQGFTSNPLWTSKR